MVSVRTGETMIRHARIALQTLNEAATEIEALKAGRTVQVKVGSISGPAISLPGWRSQYRSKHAARAFGDKRSVDAAERM